MATTAQNTMAILQATLEQFKDQFSLGENGELQIPLAELQARLEADTQKIAELAENENGKRGKGRKARKPRDPERPKRGKSAFFLWCDDNRSKVKLQIEGELRAEMDDEDEEVKVSVATVAKRLGAMWKEMSDEDKVPYNEAAEIEKSTYREAIDAYNAEHGIEKRAPTTKSTFDPAQEENVELPDGWTGPFDGYLEKHPVDPETGKRITRGFPSFAAAFAEAERLGDACGGITISTTRSGRRLTLRGAKQVVQGVHAGDLPGGYCGRCYPRGH